MFTFDRPGLSSFALQRIHGRNHTIPFLDFAGEYDSSRSLSHTHVLRDNSHCHSHCHSHSPAQILNAYANSRDCLGQVRIASLCTPTDAYLIPKEAAAAARANLAAAPIWQKVLQALAAPFGRSVQTQAVTYPYHMWSDLQVKNL